ncbi:MAG TPA: AAA family ATPase, partial [Waddliaceae bacterium]
MDQISGYIERITFQNPSNGYTIAQLKQKGKKDLTCIVGMIPSIQPGETVRCDGEWKRHPVHGIQFQVSEYKIELPADVIGIRKYLGSGLIKGIGPAYAGRIVDQFGASTLDVIDWTPEKLLEVPGLGKTRLGKIKECWEAHKSIREVMIFLQTYGVSPAYAQKIYKKYGNQSAQRVKENPYDLAKDIFGIGFKIADSIAFKLGIPKSSPQRIDAGIEYTLLKLSEEGHVCYPLRLLLEEGSQILEVDIAAINDRIQQLVNEERIIVKDLVDEGSLQQFVWKRPLYLSEYGIGREIRRLMREKSHLRSINVERALEWVQKRLHIQLALHQKSAVIKSLEEKVHIITGGPGTGKSTITNAILNITEKLTSRVLLAAPTGRAAKRMSEITSKKTFTIHSLLEIDMKNGGFKRNRENPLECDLIIIDEASMIDTSLMYSLLKAIPTHARVILVGDINQLPSVGPGN